MLIRKHLFLLAYFARSKRFHPSTLCTTALVIKNIFYLFCLFVAPNCNKFGCCYFTCHVSCHGTIELLSSLLPQFEQIQIVHLLWFFFLIGNLSNEALRSSCPVLPQTTLAQRVE